MKKIVFLLALLLPLLLLNGCVQPSDQSPATGNAVLADDAVTPADDVPVVTEPVKSDFEKLQDEVSREKAFEENRRPHRDTYGIPLEVFDNLPQIPDDFGTMTYMFQIGRWKDLKYFTEAYYLQPEFYPLFAESGLKWWKQPDPSSWAVVGYGAFPADIWASTNQGSEFTAQTFWHVGWGVQTKQGFNLQPVYPSSSRDESGKVFNEQDPLAASHYFDVSFDEPVFLLGQTYPQFDARWAKRLNVHVKVAEDTPPGTYVLGIETGTPPEEQRTEWLETYKMSYFDASSGGISLDRPHFRLIITVKEKE